jgi:hypothetical protein
MDDCDTCSDSLEGSDEDSSDEDLYTIGEGVAIPGSHGQMNTGRLLDLYLSYCASHSVFLLLTEIIIQTAKMIRTMMKNMIQRMMEI